MGFLDVLVHGAPICKDPLTEGAGELLAVLAALARSRLAGLALITWKLLTASATSTLL